MASEAILSAAREELLLPEFKDYKCPLCSQSDWQSKKTYATHVGRHLEEISLACLPRDEEDSSDNELDSEESSTPGDMKQQPNFKKQVYESGTDSNNLHAGRDQHTSNPATPANIAIDQEPGLKIVENRPKETVAFATTSESYEESVHITLPYQSRLSTNTYLPQPIKKFRRKLYACWHQ